jgi:lysozyme
MKRLAAALILAGILTPLARAQEFADMQNIKAQLSALKAQSPALIIPKPPAPSGRREDSHYMGQSLALDEERALPTGQTPDISAYPVRGLDISHHNGDIVWSQVRAQGLSFVFIKATEGGDYVDPNFQTNWSSSAAAGMQKGAYHFYNFCKTGAEQADNFIKTVPVEAGALPVVLDLEQSSDCAQLPAKDAFLKDLAAFTAKIQAAYGSAPILYINNAMYNQYLTGSVAAYKLWIADPSHTAPLMPAGETWALWQYAWHGKVAGIGSEVDLDVYSGTDILQLLK